VTRASAAGSGAGRRSRRAARIRPTGRLGQAPAATPTAATSPIAEGPASGLDSAPALRPNFAHASEAEMARILDFYQVRWEYEPHIFPVVWNLEGAVVESFAPDFWLPDLGLYLEMTTLRQKLVRKKNRKLRRVLELYPDLRVKLFYARDFRALMLKFGKLGLVAELSGTSGQVTPIRPESADAVAALELAAEPDPPTLEEQPES
jgi:hypoxanthine phosphoribosyltransferase